jgi:uncharacterized membrane protein
MLLMLMMRLRLKTRLKIRMVVQKKCPRARFYAQDFRQQITAIALAIVTRFFAAATLRKPQRVAIQQVPSPLMLVNAQKIVTSFPMSAHPVLMVGRDTLVTMHRSRHNMRRPIRRSL